MGARFGRPLCFILVVVACHVLAAPAIADGKRRCDLLPTGVAYEDHSLPFTVPTGLMPDPRFDGRAAQLDVHRVRPTYSHGKCDWVPNHAAVLIHGRALTGPPMFDLLGTDPVHGVELSLQKALARAGIDTFAPSLLGYGRSTRFADGLDDPGNASLPLCPQADGLCDETLPPNPPDQQGTLLINNPLTGSRRAHSSSVRFARMDTWVRDIRQVIDHAIATAEPSEGEVALVGLSAGGVRVGRALDPANRILPPSAADLAKVNRAVFLSSLFRVGGTEEPPSVTAPTFPLALTGRAGSAAIWTMPPPREAACGGHVVAGSQDQLWSQQMEHDGIGATWGGTFANPAGLLRSPTFSTYGWNETVAGRLRTPTLVMHGLEDTLAPPANAAAIYTALTVTNKVLVQVQCASHALPWEGCDGARCEPGSGTPYGTFRGARWPGPHHTLKAALIEWIWNGTFNGASSGRFIVDESGVASEEPAG